MPIKINGSTSGSTTITAPATGTDETIELSTVLAAKAPLASPTLTGTPTAPTATAGTNTTQIATTAFARSAGGLVLLGTQTFSGSSGINFDNVFSATYDSYEVRAYVVSDNSYSFGIQLRASGTPSATAWNFIIHEVYSNTQYIVTSTNQTYGYLGGLETTYGVYNATICRPFAAAPTVYRAWATRAGSSANPETWNTGGGHNVSTSYDGITFYPTVGTMTGRISIFGISQS